MYLLNLNNQGGNLDRDQTRGLNIVIAIKIPCRVRNEDRFLIGMNWVLPSLQKTKNKNNNIIQIKLFLRT